MTRIVFFNGPPGSGKDHVGRIASAYLQRNGMTTLTEKVAHEVKRAVHLLYGQPEDPYHFENCKDTPLDVFGGLTPRQAYIHYSERVIKPLHGNDYFGKKLLGTLLKPENRHVDIVLITDSGFYDEVRPIFSHFRPEACFLVRMHAEGCNFDKDSRSHLDLDADGVISIDIQNNLDESLEDEISLMLNSFLLSNSHRASSSTSPHM